MIRKIGGIVDLQPLGEGANAFVLKGRDMRHDRIVAVKVLKSACDEPTMRRFDRECRAMGRLSEIPNIVPIYSSGQTSGGEPYLVMPLMEDSLKSLIASNGPIPPIEAARLLAPIARAIQSAHDRGVLHLDLKPANILLDKVGVLHVADFGISEITDCSGSLSGTMMTPAFAAPERFDDLDPTALVDVYALGAVLFAMLIGLPPFSSTTGSSSPTATMRRILDEEPPIHDLPNTTPPKMIAVIRRALTKDPSHRLPSAGEFADILEEITSQLPSPPSEKEDTMDTFSTDDMTVPRNQLQYDDVTESAHVRNATAMDSYPIFPFYIVVDTSLSMQKSIGAINDELPFLKREVEEDPIVGDIARFGIITFSSDARMALPLSDLLDVEAMPSLTAKGSTNYEAAFEFLYGAIQHDMDWFKSNGAQIYRPAVFFITDGYPDRDCDWQPPLQRLVDPSFKYRPNIVTFGFGSASEGTLAQVATFKAYAANAGESPSEVLRTIARELTRSIMASSQAASKGQASLALPQEIPGMYEIPIDLL